MQKNNFTTALGLDIGEKRIGVARINSVARIPEPLTTLVNDATFHDSLSRLINEHSVDLLVVGLPRNMSGQETAQSKYVKDFTDDNIIDKFGLPCEFADETLSTVEANRYPRDIIVRSGLDAVAAAEILKMYVG